MDEWFKGVVIGLIAGFAIGILSGAFIGDRYFIPIVEELGESICEEEYNLDFESYIDGVLICKPFKESYDGIKIEINNGGN